MKSPLGLLIIFFASLSFTVILSKTLDPYKVLGVERNASQREIQKAFHKLSLQYHPDKNKNKGAQEKFAEINNAYDILSNEEKRKNYDLYGDEKGNPGFDGGNPGDQGGYTYFKGGGPGHGDFNFRPDGWQSTGGQGGSKSFSFSFGGPSSQSLFGFGFDDIFSSFFGGNAGGRSQYGGFSSSARSESGSRSSHKSSIPSVNLEMYRREVVDKGMTWLLLASTPSVKGSQYYESIVEEVASSLHGALKVGKVNCETDSSFCKELGLFPRRAPKVLVYSYKASKSGSLVEYNGDLDVKSLKAFCQDHLPRFSKRVNLGYVDFPSGYVETLPTVMLLSTKKDTPVIWRALSGLYHKQFLFYDAEVHDVSDTMVRKLGVDALPAVIGWLSNGDKHILKTGITVKDINSAIKDLNVLLDSFEKKNKKVASSQSRKKQADSGDKHIRLLTGYNFETVCGERAPVCIIGVFKSSSSRDKLETILSSVSQKSLSRHQSAAFTSKESISYALLDGAKQRSFLNSLDKSVFKSSDKFLLAYKARKGKFATFTGDISMEEVEKFISSVLNGDVHFRKVQQKPILK